jgi:hypothetical protein
MDAGLGGLPITLRTGANSLETKLISAEGPCDCDFVGALGDGAGIKPATFPLRVKREPGLPPGIQKLVALSPSGLILW